MKGFLRLLYTLLLIVVFTSHAWADKPKILQLKDLQPETSAVGFSVFKGVEPQRFEVVLGEPIDKDGNSFILARIFGGPMDTKLEKIGAIAGMSGSPIFVGCTDLDDCIANGTLVGALSYSVGYFIESGPNALLTPAEYMLGARTGGYVAGAYFSNRLSNKINIGGQDFYNLMLFPKMENLQVVGNFVNHCKDSVKSDIKPGSMVSVFLATGSIDIGGSGTVTWRDDDKIYIFGHPFLGSGIVSYPFTQVSVADTLQTPFKAHKISGCYLDTKGAITVDGAFEMVGIIGKVASTLPYQVELRIGNGGGVLTEEIAESSFASILIQDLPFIWAEQSLGDLGHLSLFYQFQITLRNQPEIFVRNMVPVQIYKNPFEEVFKNVFRSIQALKESDYGYGIERVKVRLNVIKDFQLWTVKRAFLSQEKAIPGETIFVNIILKEYFSSAMEQISIPVKVPNDFIERTDYSGAPRAITVIIQSGNKFKDKVKSAEINSVEDLVKELNKTMNYRTDVLYVQEIMPKTKAQQESDEASAKVNVKPAWKWTDVEEGDLKQLPYNDRNEIVLTLSPTLNDFIDLNLIFNLEIQPKKNITVEDKNKKKHRKWFIF